MFLVVVGSNIVTGLVDTRSVSLIGSVTLLLFSAGTLLMLCRQLLVGESIGGSSAKFHILFRHGIIAAFPAYR